jgi:hypothetical protein
MKLVNFELATPSFSIELVGLGVLWDLHNTWSFEGVSLDSKNNTAVMKWMIDDRPSAKYSGCRLIFTDLKRLAISARDEDLPLSEDLCLSSVSKVLPEPNPEPAFRMKAQWGVDEAFHLLFQFQSRRSIEIDAETVELDGVISPEAR